MSMIVDTVCGVALHCARCGRVHSHAVSCFTGRNPAGKELRCCCGELQAEVSGVHRHQIILKVFCVTCEMFHLVLLPVRVPGGVEKIYCRQTGLELGLYGEARQVEMAVSANDRQMARLFRQMDKDAGLADEKGSGGMIVNPQVLLQVLNRVHDIAEKGGIYCRCGAQKVRAILLDEGIELSCRVCGAHRFIEARDEKDLLRVNGVEKIELGPGHEFRFHR